MAIADPATAPTGQANPFSPLPPPNHHAPLRVADDVFLIRQLQGEGVGPMAIYVNSLVIAGDEPVIVDTGAANNREHWLRDVFTIVDPPDVRWIYISHDDVDHLGNLDMVLDACPNATLVVDWLIVERTSVERRLPMNRMRWVNEGDHFQAGNRTLVALRPPTYDAPTTRGLFDTRSRVYWASDSFGAPVAHAADAAADLPLDAWSQSLSMFNRMLSPWAAVADPVKFSDRVQAVRSLDPQVIATCHGPVIGRAQIDTALQVMSGLPSMGTVPLPGQDVLEGMLAAITGGAVGDAPHH